jgi:hypothetical protein
MAASESDPRPGTERLDRALTAMGAVQKFAAETGAAEMQARLQELHGRWEEQTVRIVVAGMQKRGKSRLINALLNRPGLVPVDEDVATNSHIRIGHGTISRAEVRRAGHPQPAEIPLAEIGDYASILGDPAKRRDVLEVAVTLPHDLLDGVVLYDTPGVDSLTIGHRHATELIVRQSDVLIFAVSGQDQPLLRHELEFLVEAAASVDRVAFVLTKVDNAPRWADLLAANRERLRAHLDAPIGGTPAPPEVRRRLLDARWIPVSARRAEVGRAVDDDPEHAERLLAASGMPELEGFIRECADERTIVRLGPLLTMAGRIAEALASQQRDVLAAATEDDQALRERQAQAQAATERMSRRAERRKVQGTRISFLGGTVDRMVRTRADELRREYIAEIDEADLSSRAKLTAYAESLPDSLDRSFDALWQGLLAEVQDVVAESLNEFLRDMELDAVDVTIDPARPAPDRWTGAAPTLSQPGFDLTGDGVRALTLSWALGGILGALIMPGVGLVVGPTVAGLVTWKHRQKTQAGVGRTELRGYVRGAVQQVSSDVSAALSEFVQLKRAEVEGLVDSEIAAQRADLRRRSADVANLRQQDDAARGKAAAEARSRLERIDRIMADLRAARPAAAPVGGAR